MYKDPSFLNTTFIVKHMENFTSSHVHFKYNWLFFFPQDTSSRSSFIYYDKH